MINFEWWIIAVASKDDLISLIARFHPAYQRPYLKYKITANGAEKACESIRQGIVAEYDDISVDLGLKKFPVEEALAAFQDRDSQMLWTLLNETWFGMPEAEAIHGEPGFNALCDLCSEFEG